MITLSPPPNVLYLINRSTLVGDDQASAIASALNVQLTRDLCPAWGLAPMRVAFLSHGAVLPPGAPTLTLVDTLDDAQALGYHTEDDGTPRHRRGNRVCGYVGVRATLDQGNHVLTGPYSVSSIASHEACELAVDRHCNEWADDGHGHEVAVEVCDPVQSDAYMIDGVTVSNFATPAFFDPGGVGPFDLLGDLHAPLTLDRGGYWVSRSSGGPGKAVFGEGVPEWLREVKRHPGSRTQHRVAADSGPDAAEPSVIGGRHPSVAGTADFLLHVNPRLDGARAEVADLFRAMTETLLGLVGDDSAELAVALRKLLEAKDAAVRAVLPQ